MSLHREAACKLQLHTVYSSVWRKAENFSFETRDPCKLHLVVSQRRLTINCLLVQYAKGTG